MKESNWYKLSQDRWARESVVHINPFLKAQELNIPGWEEYEELHSVNE